MKPKRPPGGDDRSTGRTLSESDAVRLLADALPVCVSYVDSDLIYRFNNRAYEEWFNVERGMITGRPVSDLIGEPAFEANRERMEKALSGERVQYETEVHYRDGSTRHVRGSFIPDIRETGEVKGFFSLVDDITEAKQADRRARDLFLEAAPDATVIVDHNAVIALINKQAERLFGYSRSELLGRPIDLLIPESYRIKHIEHHKAYFSTPEVRSMGAELELFGRRKDGSEFPAEISLSPMRIDDRLMVASTIRDVTARKRIEARLRQSESRNRALLNAVPDLIFRLSREGIYLDFEPAPGFEPHYSAEDFLGKRIDEVMPPEVARQWMNHLRRALQTGETEGFEYELAAGGVTRYYEARLAVCERNEITVIVRDVTDRVEAQKEKGEMEVHLRQTQKLEAIGTLAGGIAHDFNNVLTSIMGFSALVEEELPQNSPHREHMREILTASERARDLVEQILTFARHGEPRRKPIEIVSVVREALRLMRASVPATIEIRQDIDERCGTVLADPTQIHQVVVNLVTNACQAIGDSAGSVEVSLRQVEVDSAIARIHPTLRGVPQVRLTVSDTGRGMDRSVRERVFEPFFTTKEAGRGTGLGLSVVHGIVTAHGGYITCRSEVGRGSSFDVYLPRLDERVNREPEKTKAAPSGAENILFVDDEAAIVQFAQETLQKAGYHVTPLTSSTEALRVFRENPERFDLVFLDVAMPRMNGVELARELLKLRPEVPIILGTGFSDFITAEEATRMGAREFVLKPYGLQDLRKTIRRVLDEAKETAS